MEISDEDIAEIKKKLEGLEKRLEEHRKRISVLESLKEKPKIFKEPTSGMEKLAEKANVSKECIERIFDIEENALTLTKVIGKDEEEKTQNISLLVLLGYEYFFEKDGVIASELRRNVAENRIPVNNFATHLNEIIPSLIRRKGKPRSPKTTYKLTISGKSTARELIKKLCKE